MIVNNDLGDVYLPFGDQCVYEFFDDVLVVLAHFLLSSCHFIRGLIVLVQRLARRAETCT
jgi:hypothetical protein